MSDRSGCLGKIAPTILFGIVPRLVTLSETPVAADVIVVLGGDATGARVEKAASLYLQGFAQTLVVSGGTPAIGGGTWAGDMRRRALEFGVPDAAILVQDRSATTAEDAELTSRLLAERGAKKAILVTSSWHSRRASALFRWICSNVEWVSCPVDQEWVGAWTDSGLAHSISLEIPKMFCAPLQVLAARAPQEKP